ncbi:MAG: LytTR family transcriptional regulator [Bacilli bacterium]|nr:LytTR family transcriptional regulator [Bacilli bacterium]
MINFIICSSNYSSRKETKEIIDSYMMNYDIEVKYHLFNNNKEELRKIHGYKVYLIEIDNNPYDLVKHIREELDDWNSIIILLAENRGIESILGTRLFLFDVIYRNASFEKILKEDLRRIIKNYDHREKCLIFENNRIIKKVDFKSIIMISKEKDSKKCLLKSLHGNYYVPESLCKISKRLDKRFVKTNRSCIINGDEIVEYNSNENKLLLRNGMVFQDVAREKKKDISNYVTNYK